MAITETRIDSSQLSADQLQLLRALVAPGEQPALVGKDGTRLELPEPVFNLLAHVVRMMQQRQAIVLIPEDETYTTQAAANHLGMSRQHFVTLLESGQIPFHRVGTHRRVYFKDLLTYEKIRDKDRHETLNQLFATMEKAGIYDSEPRGDE